MKDSAALGGEELVRIEFSVFRTVLVALVLAAMGSHCEFIWLERYLLTN